MRMFFFLLAIVLSFTAYVRSDGFTLQKIHGPLTSSTISSPSSEVQKILSQPFHYLGKGRQCFVFESQDERYVVKFFNQNYFRMPWYGWLNHKKEKAKREMRRKFFETSYEIAEKEFGEEILYLHMGPSQGLKPIHLCDPRGRKIKMNLNTIPFLIQKKGKAFYEALESIFKREGIEGLFREIKTFKAQIANRISKQIADGDSDVEHNWGYADGHIFHLDPGRLYYDPDLTHSDRQKEEWDRATQSFIKWLNSHHPEAVNLFRD